MTPAEAAPYFAHPSQRRANMLVGDMPNHCQYLARDGVCLAFHSQFWWGVWQVHIGVLPEAWGKTVEPVKAILAAFWEEQQPTRIVAWMKESNRAVVALAKRAGFEIDGRLDLAEPVLMMGWTPCQ